jgi:multidrug efflux pump subunit AcrA (membrane-fusion protein)
MNFIEVRTFSLVLMVTCLSSLCLHSVAAQESSELTAKVTKGDLKIEVEVPGEFIADDKDEIRMEPSKYKGDLIITKILPEGTPVKKDEVLMEFDTDKLDEALEEAENEVTDEEVAVKKAQAELESAKIDAESKQAQLKKELEFLEREVAASVEKQALELAKKVKEIADAESSLADANVDFQQLSELYEERELHTATENILVERAKKGLTDQEKGIAEKQKELEYFKKFELSKTQEEKQLEVDKKSLKNKRWSTRPSENWIPPTRRLKDLKKTKRSYKSFRLVMAFCFIRPWATKRMRLRLAVVAMTRWKSAGESKRTRFS